MEKMQQNPYLLSPARSLGGCPQPSRSALPLYTRRDGDTSFSPSAVPPNDTMDGVAEDTDGNIWDSTASTAVDYEASQYGSDTNKTFVWTILPPLQLL